MSVNTELTVRAVNIELQNKVNEQQLVIEQLSTTVSGLQAAIADLQETVVGATVGTGGTYATIQDALDAGESELHVLSDLTLSSDPVAPSADYTVLLVLHNQAELTFQNASFDASNDFSGVTIESAGPSAEGASGGSVQILFTAGGYANTGAIDSVDNATVKNVAVVDNSTQDGAYLARNCVAARTENLHITINEPGAARTLGGLSANASLELRDVEYALVGNTTAIYLDAQPGSSVERLRSPLASGASSSGVVLRGPNTIAQACDVSRAEIIIPEFEGDVMISGSVFSSCAFQSAAGGFQNLSATYVYFDHNSIVLSDTLTLRGEGIQFFGGYIDAASASETIALGELLLGFFGVGISTTPGNPMIFTPTSEACSVIGCYTENFSATFEMTMAGATFDHRIVGNYMTSAVAGVTGGSVFSANVPPQP